MATEIKSRRGTEAQHDDGAGFTGAEGELTVDTTNDTIRVHDGSTKGGHRLAKYTEVQASNELSEMLDVNLTSPADGSVLKYDNASSKWIDSAKLTETGSGINVTGTVTADGVSLGDNEKIQIGATQDLELFHDGTNSYVQDAGDGGLILNTTNGNGVFIHSTTESMGAFHSNGAVNLYYDNAEKFATTDTGIDVTGTVKGDSLTIDNGAGLTTAYINSATGASIFTVKSTYEGGTEWQNVGVIEVGGHDKAYIDLKKPDDDDTDLRLLHDGDGSLTAFDGDLLLQTSSSNSSGKVVLRNGGSSKLETTSTGIDVTGNITVTGTVDNVDVAALSSSVSNVDNTSDSNKPVSTATQTALDLKANIASPTFTGTVGGITSAMVGLSNVDNTTDANKPVSTATQTALDLKAPIASPTFTGTVEADAFSGTGTTAITDFITDVSTSNNDTTVPTTAAVKSYVDNNDGDTTYTGGTGLTLNGTTFNVDAAQTQITSVGTLTSLTTGDTTINGNLEVKSTTADGNFLPEIRLKRDGGAGAGDDGDVLGALVFEGDNFDGTQKDYARIGVSIKDDGTGVDSGQVKGEIRFACAAGGQGAADYETPSARIDHQGVHTNEISTDGSANSNFFHVHNSGSGGGLKFYSNDGNHTTTVKARNPSADKEITIPNIQGDIVVAAIAGGSINGGGDTTTPKTAWSLSEFIANPNSTYVHFNQNNTNDLTISVPFIGFDEVAIGSSFKFINASPVDSDIIIDIDGFTYSGTAAYALTKLDGSTNSVLYSNGSNLTIDSGGQITLTAVAAGVWLVEGIGYS